MAHAIAPRRGLTLLVLSLAISSSIAAPQSTYVIPFSGAVYITVPNYTSAQQAVCPADAPVSCSSISEPDYCCPSGNVCQMASSSVVGCCPSGSTCSGLAGQSTYEQSTYYTPTTTYEQASTYYQPYTTPYQTTANNGGGIIIPAGATTVYTNANNPTTVYTSYQQQTTQQNFDNQQYCSTLVENGPGLPTTAAAQCGTILIVSELSVAANFDMDVSRELKMVAYIGAMHVLGALVFGLGMLR